MFQPQAANDHATEPGAPLRKNPGRADLPAIDPNLRAGAKLALARQIRGLTLDQVAERTRVRRDYLEALEMMNVKLLPGRAYALAYLRSYATVLGLEPEALLAQFQVESALTREDAKAQLRNPESKPRHERPWLAAVAIAALAVGFLGWRAWEDRDRDPRLQTAERSAPAPAPEPVLLPREPEPAVAPAPGEAAAVPAAAAAVVVELKALAPAWLEVRGPDGTIFLSRTLQPGDRYRPDIGAGWTVHARDGAAFEVSLDGRVVGLLGEAQAPVLGRKVDTLAENYAVAPSSAAPAAAGGPAAAAPKPASAAPAPAPAAQAPPEAAPATAPEPEILPPAASGVPAG